MGCGRSQRVRGENGAIKNTALRGGSIKRWEEAVLVSVLMFLMAMNIVFFVKTDDPKAFAVLCAFSAFMASPFVMLLVFKIFPMLARMRV